MKDLFIPYETGIPSMLKEKGFDEPCFGAFNLSDELKISNEVSCSVSQDMCRMVFDGISAPLYQQILDWFRYKHQIIITIDVSVYSLKAFGHIKSIKNKQGFWSNKEEAPLEYYEAFNKAIEEALKLID